MSIHALLRPPEVGLEQQEGVAPGLAHHWLLQSHTGQHHLTALQVWEQHVLHLGGGGTWALTRRAREFPTSCLTLGIFSALSTMVVMRRWRMASSSEKGGLNTSSEAFATSSMCSTCQARNGSG